MPAQQTHIQRVLCAVVVMGGGCRGGRRVPRISLSGGSRLSTEITPRSERVCEHPQAPRAVITASPPTAPASAREPVAPRRPPSQQYVSFTQVTLPLDGAHLLRQSARLQVTLPLRERKEERGGREGAEQVHVRTRAKTRCGGYPTSRWWQICDSARGLAQGRARNRRERSLQI